MMMMMMMGWISGKVPIWVFGGSGARDGPNWERGWGKGSIGELSESE